MDSLHWKSEMRDIATQTRKPIIGDWSSWSQPMDGCRAQSMCRTGWEASRTRARRQQRKRRAQQLEELVMTVHDLTARTIREQPLASLLVHTATIILTGGSMLSHQIRRRTRMVCAALRSLRQRVSGLMSLCYPCWMVSHSVHKVLGSTPSIQRGGGEPLRWPPAVARSSAAERGWMRFMKWGLECGGRVYDAQRHGRSRRCKRSAETVWRKEQVNDVAAHACGECGTSSGSRTTAASWTVEDGSCLVPRSASSSGTPGDDRCREDTVEAEETPMTQSTVRPCSPDGGHVDSVPTENAHFERVDVPPVEGA